MDEVKSKQGVSIFILVAVALMTLSFGVLGGHLLSSLTKEVAPECNVECDITDSNQSSQPENDVYTDLHTVTVDGIEIELPYSWKFIEAGTETRALNELTDMFLQDYRNGYVAVLQREFYILSNSQSTITLGRSPIFSLGAFGFSPLPVPDEYEVVDKPTSENTLGFARKLDDGSYTYIEIGYFTEDAFEFKDDMMTLQYNRIDMTFEGNQEDLQFADSIYRAILLNAEFDLL